jgi:hypothetical protein
MIGMTFSAFLVADGGRQTMKALPALEVPGNVFMAIQT